MTNVSPLAYDQHLNCLTLWPIFFCGSRRKAGVSYLIHCLDDYPTVGPPLSQVCQHNLWTFSHHCAKTLVFLLATDKLEGPATSLSFLGIILDTSCMEIRLPIDKFSRTREMIKAWLPRKRLQNESYCHWLAHYNMLQK